MLCLKLHHWPNLVPFNASCVLGQLIWVEFLHVCSDVKWNSWRLHYGQDERLCHLPGQHVAMSPEAKGD